MQKMLIVQKGRSWYLRYRSPELVTNRRGDKVRKEVWKQLAPVDKRYPSKRHVEAKAREILNRINATSTQPNSSQRVVDFIEHAYFPAIETKRRPSTVFGYRHMFDKHVKSRLGDLRLFDFDAAAGQKLLRKIADETKLSHTSLKHLKHFLAGVVTFAIQEGILKLAANPMHLLEIPEGQKSEGTQAYNLDQIATMMEVLPEPARTIVAVAGFTGLRRSELRGLRWEDLDGDQLRVQRTVWNTIIQEKTKTETSKAPVPLVPMLKELLEAHRNGADGFIFAGEKLNRPLNLANLARRIIVPALRAAGVEWSGWHAFRRGLATNLYAIGTKENVIQDILRHADVKVTRSFYIKPTTANSQPAMQKLAKVFQVVRKSARKATQEKVLQPA